MAHTQSGQASRQSNQAYDRTKEGIESEYDRVRSWQDEERRKTLKNLAAPLLDLPARTTAPRWFVNTSVIRFLGQVTLLLN